MFTGNLGVGGGGAEAPFTVKMSHLFRENALVSIANDSRESIRANCAANRLCHLVATPP